MSSEISDNCRIKNLKWKAIILNIAKQMKERSECYFEFMQLSYDHFRIKTQKLGKTQLF